MFESPALASSTPVTSATKTRPTRVLHVISPSTVGGLERVVCTLASGQLSAGMQPYVAAVVEPDVRDHPVVTELRDSGVEVDVICVPLRTYALERRLVAAACTRWGPDVMHTHGYRTNLVDSKVARSFGIARVSTFHGFTGGPLRNRFYEWLDRRVARGMDAVIAVSRAVGDRLAASGVPAERVHVVPNAHNPRKDFLDRRAAREALGLPQNAFIVGWIGRLTTEKGADILVDAMSLFDGQDVEASFIGDGAERAALTARAAERAPSRVRWHGLIHSAAAYFRAFDVFSLSSRTEGTPMVLFEAMDAGVPIVATRVGGVPDVLRAQDAILIDPDNALSLAAAIDAVRSDPASARTRANSARARLRDYDVGSWVNHHHAIYQQVAGMTTVR